MTKSKPTPLNPMLEAVPRLPAWPVLRGREGRGESAISHPNHPWLYGPLHSAFCILNSAFKREGRGGGRLCLEGRNFESLTFSRFVDVFQFSANLDQHAVLTTRAKQTGGLRYGRLEVCVTQLEVARLLTNACRYKRRPGPASYTQSETCRSRRRRKLLLIPAI